MIRLSGMVFAFLSGMEKIACELTAAMKGKPDIDGVWGWYWTLDGIFSGQCRYH